METSRKEGAAALIEGGRGRWALGEHERGEIRRVSAGNRKMGFWLFLLAASQFIGLFLASWVSLWGEKTSGLISPRRDRTLLAPSCCPFCSSCCSQQASFSHAAGAAGDEGCHFHQPPWPSADRTGWWFILGNCSPPGQEPWPLGTGRLVLQLSF